MGIGGAVFEGNSKLFEGPLGVVKIGFKGYDLGKTGADTTLAPDQDVKDIIYQQDGTKASDHVRTGIEYILSCTFGEIKTGLLIQLMSGLSTKTTLPTSDSGVIDRNVYQSMRTNEAGSLKIVSVDANGAASVNLEDILNFYEAIPLVTGELVNWGADTQRNLPVEFHIKWHEFATGESSTKEGAFGYWGDPTTEDVPPIVYPDVEAPILESADVVDATSIDVVFNENLALVGGSFNSGSAIAIVNGIAVLATAGSVTTKTLTLTFPASSFTSSDVVELTITNKCVEDTETTPNVYQGVDSFSVTNSL